MPSILENILQSIRPFNSNTGGMVGRFGSEAGYPFTKFMSPVFPITPESIALTLTAMGKPCTWEEVLELYAYIHYADNVDWDRLLAYREGMKRRGNSG